MSVVSIAFDEAGVRFGCRPERGRPAGRLESFCRVPLPERTGSVATEGFPLHIALMQALNPARAAAVATPLSSCFAKLAQDLNQDEVFMAQCLDQPVTRLVFVPPFGTRPQELETLRRTLQNIPGMDITVVANPVAAGALVQGGFKANTPFLLCSWIGDLTLSTAMSYNTMRHFSEREPKFRLGNSSPEHWAPLIERGLRAELGLATDPGEAELCVTSAALHACAAALIASILRDGPPYRISISGTDPKNGQSRTIVHAFSVDGLQKMLAPLRAKLRNFLEERIPELGEADDASTVCCGDACFSPVFSDVLLDVFAKWGFSESGTERDTALFGAHDCVRERPLMPYDCGVLFRERGLEYGIGTLVLIRPTAIGQSRTSSELRLPISEGRPAEVAVYVRRLDPAAGKISCDVLRTHLVAPRLNDNHEAVVKVEMCVNGDPDLDETPTVDVRVMDMNAAGAVIVTFSRLTLDGGTHMSHPPFRKSTVIGGARLGDLIVSARSRVAGGGARMSVAEWRANLTGPKPALLTRRQYRDIHLSQTNRVTMFMRIRGVNSPHIQAVMQNRIRDDAYARTCSPDDLQRHLRQIQRDAMNALADDLNHIRGNKGFARTWKKGPGSLDPPPSEPEYVDSFLNAITQDIAGTPEEELYTQQAESVANLYRHACAPPQALNVKWAVWEDEA